MAWMVRGGPFGEGASRWPSVGANSETRKTTVLSTPSGRRGMRPSWVDICVVNQSGGFSCKYVVKMGRRDEVELLKGWKKKRVSPRAGYG